MNAAAISEARPDDVKSKGTELRPRGEATRPRFILKTHVAFWRARVERRTYEYEGKTLEVPEYSVRMKFGGIRKRLALGTALKEEAALKARDIYLSLVAKGWSVTLAEAASKSAVEAVRSEVGPTVGEFIAEVERTSNLKTKTFRRYAQYFRMLAAQIQGSEDRRVALQLSRWRERVDAIPLSAITPAAVADWKIAYLRRAGNHPRRKLEVNRSFNSALLAIEGTVNRFARCLFVMSLLLRDRGRRRCAHDNLAM